MINKIFLKKWLLAYNHLEANHDRLWLKYVKYQNRGDVIREREYAERMEYVEAYQEGMIEALHIFGYDMQLKDGKYVVVEL